MMMKTVWMLCNDRTLAVTVKMLELIAVPLGVVMPIWPEVALVGTMAVICVFESTLKAAFVPLNATIEAEAKFVPVMTTLVFALPLVGEKPKATGGGLVSPSTLLRSAEATGGGRAVKNVNPVSF